MPAIAQARIQPFTGNITFKSEPPETGSQVPTAPSAATTANLTGTGATGPTGPRGPSGIPGPPTLLTSSAITLTLAAIVGATASAILASSTYNLLAMQLTAVTTGPVQNYVLTLFDGDPTSGGIMVYQATGITAESYIDNAPFFIPLTSGHLWGQITNIDADVTVLTLTLMSLIFS